MKKDFNLRQKRYLFHVSQVIILAWLQGTNRH